jgi:hypothetical protein
MSGHLVACLILTMVKQYLHFLKCSKLSVNGFVTGYRLLLTQL